MNKAKWQRLLSQLQKIRQTLDENDKTHAADILSDAISAIRIAYDDNGNRGGI